MTRRVERVLHSLLRHYKPEVKTAAYAELGNHLVLVDNQPSRVKFLFSKVILRNVLEDGMCSSGPEAEIASGLVDRLLRSRRLFHPSDWDQFVRSLVPNLPFLIAHGNEDAVDGHMILAVTLEDSRSDVLCLTRAEELLCAVRGLFSVDAALRHKAFLRTMGLVADDPEAHRKLSLFGDPPLVTPDFLHHVRPVQLERLRRCEGDERRDLRGELNDHLVNCSFSPGQSLL